MAKDQICRSFRQDFPEFVARAEALGVKISLSEGRRKGRDRVFWLNGYRQLTGYTTRSDGGGGDRDRPLGPHERRDEMKSDLIDIDGAVEARTDKAVLFHTGDKEKAAWLPLSQIEIEETGLAGIFTVTLPEWLALDKGLI